MDDNFDNNSFGDHDLDNADVKIRPEFYAHLVLSKLPACWDGDSTVEEGNLKKMELVKILGAICKAAEYVKKDDTIPEGTNELVFYMSKVFDKKNIKGHL